MIKQPPSTRPVAADDGHVIDQVIDQALSTLRTDRPNQADCEAAMAALLNNFDRLESQ